MVAQQFQREHLRAPMKTKILYLGGDYVFKAYTLNISVGGVLLENLPHVPEVKSIPLMVPLTHYPELSQLGMEVIKGLQLESFPRSVMRLKARIVRSFEGVSEVDKIFVTKIGCEFVFPTPESRELIEEYISLFSKNLVFFLNLFEGKGTVGDPKIVLRKVANVLGYDPKMQIGLLRLKALHDYQSLESC